MTNLWEVTFNVYWQKENYSATVAKKVIAESGDAAIEKGRTHVMTKEVLLYDGGEFPPAEVELLGLKLIFDVDVV